MRRVSVSLVPLFFRCPTYHHQLYRRSLPVISAVRCKSTLPLLGSSSSSSPSSSGKAASFLFDRKSSGHRRTQQKISKMSGKADKHGRDAKPVSVCERLSRENNTAVVLAPEGGDFMTIDLSFSALSTAAGEEVSVVKSMSRLPADATSKTLDRIRLLCSPQAASRKKQSKEELLGSCPPVSLWAPDADAPRSDALVPVDVRLPNAEAWAKATELRVGETRVRVCFNPPTVTSVVPPKCAYVGLPLVCSNIAVLFASDEEIIHEWFVEGGAGAAPKLLSTERVIVPSEEHAGKVIVLRIAAGKDSPLWTQVRLPPVQRPPPPVERWASTRSPASGSEFRVVTYNILFEDFCTSKHSKTFIYPFATDEMLDTERRQARILQELLAYNADLILLQECGKKTFQNFLLPTLKACGFDGFYTNKNGSVQEGHSCFYRSARYKLLNGGPTAVPLNWERLQQAHGDLAAAVEAHAELKEALGHLTTTGTVATLYDAVTEREVVVGNTHLFYHANACHIRILQLYMFLCALKDAAHAGGAARPIVFCGDCNFTHSTGAYRLVTTGQLEAGHHSWEKGKLFWWGCDRLLGYSEEELAAADLGGAAASASVSATAGGDSSKVKGQVPERPPLEQYFKRDLLSPLRLLDVYDRTDPSMPWTNYTMTFKEVIDYIFCSEESLKVVRSVPIPPETELNVNFAIPNLMYPSDHVALIADLDYHPK